ncbi:MAG: hypothetical protein OEY14_08265 [Myxococcales bacterium]|nr:hypothetical protein [Myxococcales bacterium]
MRSRFAPLIALLGLLGCASTPAPGSTELARQEARPSEEAAAAAAAAAAPAPAPSDAPSGDEPEGPPSEPPRLDGARLSRLLVGGPIEAQRGRLLELLGLEQHCPETAFVAIDTRFESRECIPAAVRVGEGEEAPSVAALLVLSELRQIAFPDRRGSKLELRAPAGAAGWLEALERALRAMNRLEDVQLETRAIEDEAGIRSLELLGLRIRLLPAEGERSARALLNAPSRGLGR